MAFDLAKTLQDVSKLDTGNRPQLQYIHLDHLGSDPNNFYELTSIEALATNIELVGLQQPIRVRQSGEGAYIIVSGHRRCAAIRLLVDEGKDFAQVPCLVDNQVESPEMQELRLIYGNSDTRKLSSSDLAKQAERVEELLYKLKDQGVDFPGRMRDHVAQACQVSASKLARLRVIQRDLCAHFMGQWQRHDLTEQAAYALSRIPKDVQMELAEVMPKKIVDGYAAERLLKRWEKLYGGDRTCPDGGPCYNGVNMMRQTACCRYEWGACKGGCCLECRNLHDCKFICSAAKPLVAEKKERDAQQTAAANAELEKSRAKQAKEVKAWYSLIISLATAAGLGDKSKIPHVVYNGSQTLYALKNCVSGKSEINPYALTAKSLRVEELLKLAHFLQCDVNVLLGNDSVVPSPPSADGTSPRGRGGDGWRTDGNYPEGRWIAFLFPDDDEPELALVREGHLIWDGIKVLPEPIRRWCLLPIVPKVEDLA